MRWPRPSYTHGNAQRLFSAYYDTGHIEVTLSRGQAESQVTGWAAHHRFICEMHQHAAGLLYEGMGCREVTTYRMECIGSGGQACRVKTTWR